MTQPLPVAAEATVDEDARFYLDAAATTAVLPEVRTAILRGLDLYGNPSSRHGLGQDAREALDEARVTVAKLLGGAPDEVVFTGGGSEAVNLALWGCFCENGFTGHLVTTSIEHSAVLETASALRRRGVDVTVVAPRPSGHVSAEAVRRAIRPDTTMVSIMHANNETGAIQPVEAITRIAHDSGAIVHIDAVQTAGKRDLTELRADLVSISAHKFGGPKGVGALRLRSGIRLAPLINGGGQERGRRAGTENLPGVLGMAAAAEHARRRVADDRAHREAIRLRGLFLDRLSTLDGLRINVSETVLPETISLAFAGVRGDTLTDILDTYGICVSTGSACHAADSSPSHVLAAMGVADAVMRSTIRVSFGHDIGEARLCRAADRIRQAVTQLRRVSGTSMSNSEGALA